MKVGTRTKLLFVTFLTFVRFPLVLLFLVAAITHSAAGGTARWLFVLSFVSLTASAVTDFFDGYLARRLRVVTKFGAHADPLMDKFFYLASLPLLVFVAARNGHFKHAAFLLVLAILFLLRDQWVTFLRSIGSMYSVSGAADWSGKLRTGINFPLICAIYYCEAAPASIQFIPMPLLRAFEFLGLAVNLLSVYTYTRRYWPYLRRATELPSDEELQDRNRAAEPAGADPGEPADRDASQRAMATRVAHDFGNLLTAVMGNADLALKALPRGAPARPSVEEVRESAAASLDLVNQLSDYAGRANYAMAPLALGPWMAALRADVQAMVPDSIRVQFDVPETLPGVRGEPQRLRHAVLNLVQNAVEAIGEAQGRVRIAVSATPAAQPGQPGQVVIAVEDSGCGMTPAVRAHAMEPFFTTRIRGRGMGLPVARGIALAHGGSIALDSQPGKGTIARITLPEVRATGPTRPDGATGNG